LIATGLSCKGKRERRGGSPFFSAKFDPAKILSGGGEKKGGRKGGKGDGVGWAAGHRPLYPVFTTLSFLEKKRKKEKGKREEGEEGSSKNNKSGGYRETRTILIRSF